MELTKSAFEKEKQLNKTFLNTIVNTHIEKKTKKSYDRYWNKQNNKAGIIIRRSTIDSAFFICSLVTN